MRALLDTQAFVWYVLDDARLGTDARHIIGDGENIILVSPASYWESAIKVALGKYTLSVPYVDFWRKNVEVNQFTVLPIEIGHTAALVSLPQHHRDPFDRLLVAQALVEGVPLISSDAALDAYGLKRIW